MLIPVLTPAQSAAGMQRALAGGIAVATLMDAAGRASAAVLADRYGPALAGRRARGRGHRQQRRRRLGPGPGLHRHDVPVWVAAPPRNTLPAQCARPVRRPRRGRAGGRRPTARGRRWRSRWTRSSAPAPRAPRAHRPRRSSSGSGTSGFPLSRSTGRPGVDLLTGATWGPAGANLSITFGAPRRGHLLARDEVGDVVVVDIGLPAAGPRVAHGHDRRAGGGVADSVRRGSAQGRSRPCRGAGRKPGHERGAAAGGARRLRRRCRAWCSPSPRRRRRRC